MENITEQCTYFVDGSTTTVSCYRPLDVFQYFTVELIFAIFGIMAMVALYKMIRK